MGYPNHRDTASDIPAGFYIRADEMRDAGIRVHDEIDDHTRYTPPSRAKLLERVAIARATHNSALESLESAKTDATMTDGIRNYIEFGAKLTIKDIASTLVTWNQRWVECGGKTLGL